MAVSKLISRAQADDKDPFPLPLNPRATSKNKTTRSVCSHDAVFIYIVWKRPLVIIDMAHLLGSSITC